jgi:hypothetical protein
MGKTIEQSLFDDCPLRRLPLRWPTLWRNISPLPITFELKAYEILDECAEIYDKLH